MMTYHPILAYSALATIEYARTTLLPLVGIADPDGAHSFLIPVAAGDAPAVTVGYSAHHRLSDDALATLQAMLSPNSPTFDPEFAIAVQSGAFAFVRLRDQYPFAPIAEPDAAAVPLYTNVPTLARGQTVTLSDFLSALGLVVLESGE